MKDRTTTVATLERQALARRSNGGIDVSLFWTTVGELLTLEVRDTGSGEYFALGVSRARARGTRKLLRSE